MDADKRALWFAIGLSCTAGLMLIAMVAISNAVQGASADTIYLLGAPAIPIAWLAGFGLGRGRN